MWTLLWAKHRMKIVILAGFLAGGTCMELARVALRNTRQHWSPAEKLLLFVQSECGDRRVSKLLMRYAQQYEIDPLAFLAVIWKESGFNPQANSKRAKGRIDEGGLDRGLGGLCEDTAKRLLRDYLHYNREARRIAEAPSRLYASDLNLDITGANLRRLLDEHKSCHDIWDAYKFHNSGDEGKGSLKNVTAVKDRYYLYRRKFRRFDWRKAR